MLPERIRTFTAIELTDELRENIWQAERALMDDFPRGVRWVPKENLHVTLKFLGMVYRDLIPEIVEELHAAVRKCSQVATAVEQVELFPPNRKPRMVSVHVHKDPHLEALYKAVDGRLARLRIKKEHRRYLPHITLGRIEKRVVGRFMEYDLAGLGERMGTLPVTHVSFFMSETGRGSPTYTRLGRVEIGV